ncbi:MAG TPA: hypothetical protein VIS48_13080 [Candidatus Kryptonia bacterium]
MKENTRSKGNKGGELSGTRLDEKDNLIAQIKERIPEETRKRVELTHESSRGWILLRNSATQDLKIIANLPQREFADWIKSIEIEIANEIKREEAYTEGTLYRIAERELDKINAPEHITSGTKRLGDDELCQALTVSEKLKGLYISKRLENNHLKVSVQIGAGFDEYDVTACLEVWKTREAQWTDQLDLLIYYPEQNKASIEESKQQKDLCTEKVRLFQEIIMVERAGLPIDKYWEGKYQEPMQEVRKKKGKNESDKVKRQVEKLQKKFPDKSKDELFHQAAEDSGKSYEAIKRSYYYKRKKVTKRVT